MISHGNTLLSEELLSEQFVCDLQKCKGACCVEGDAGAPLEPEEVDILKKEYSNFESYLRPEGRASVAKQGTHVIDPMDGEPVTPLVNGAECAYVVFDEKGTTLCGIEKAWRDGKTSFRKPVSCHLYPIRIQRYKSFDAVNYHKWQICAPACDLGKELKVPVFRFAKDALIRKYGEKWFQELEILAEQWEQS
ncbi:DUF3109 family protein [Croceimicrobium sp.]|uniref:DUF3109 family protein n=1 Tax=Croceimicrobium sp. TaxID=2828340 RepID=UPI003BABE064